MEITLTKIGGEEINDATFNQIKNAFLEVYQAKGSGRGNYIILSRFGEEELEIYLQSIVWNNYSLYPYDGPGGPTEEYVGRYEEGTILPFLEEICNLFDNGDGPKLEKVLKSLPKPKEN